MWLIVWISQKVKFEGMDQEEVKFWFEIVQER